MHWTHQALGNLSKCFQAERFKPWSDAVEAGAGAELSQEAQDLAARLASILMVEVGLGREHKDKFVKILELAALGGKTL